MEKLPISIGILAWNSGKTLVNTLGSYQIGGLLEMVNDVTIFFQEVTDEDIIIAQLNNIEYIGSDENIGIGRAFLRLAENAQTNRLLLLEHDWKLIEDRAVTYERLLSGLELLDNGINLVKYRHRTQPGVPLYTQLPYQGNELNHYDDEIDLISPHLLECIHWVEHPEREFIGKINKQGEYYTATSRWANWTNNPGLFDTQFFIDTITPFVGTGIELEGKISKWWSRQNFNVAHGEGLFKHEDIIKYG